MFVMWAVLWFASNYRQGSKAGIKRPSLNHRVARRTKNALLPFPLGVPWACFLPAALVKSTQAEEAQDGMIGYVGRAKLFQGWGQKGAAQYARMELPVALVDCLLAAARDVRRVVHVCNTQHIQNLTLSETVGLFSLSRPSPPLKTGATGGQEQASGGAFDPRAGGPAVLFRTSISLEEPPPRRCGRGCCRAAATAGRGHGNNK